MAYLRDYARLCDHPYCNKRAAKELRTTRNETIGYFCTKHANEALKKQQSVEDKAGPVYSVEPARL
jgi:hypothetical protein